MKFIVKLLHRMYYGFKESVSNILIFKHETWNCKVVIIMIHLGKSSLNKLIKAMEFSIVGGKRCGGVEHAMDKINIFNDAFPGSCHNSTPVKVGKPSQSLQTPPSPPPQLGIFQKVVIFLLFLKVQPPPVWLVVLILNGPN